MNLRSSMARVAIAATIVVGLSACGSDGSTGTPAGTGTTLAPTGSAGGAVNTSGLAWVTYPAGAKVTDLATNQKQYEVTGLTLEQVKQFFDDEFTGAGYTRTQEASASRFYLKGGQKIQVTYADFGGGTIRGVVRILA